MSGITIIICLKYVVQLLLVFLLWFEYRLKYIAKDGRTIEHKRTRVVVLIVGIVAVLLGIGSMIADDMRKSKESRATAQHMTNVNFQLNDIKEKQGANFQENHQIWLALATNSAPTSAIESALIQSEEHFEAINSEIWNLTNWLDEFHSKLNLAQLKIDQANKEAEVVSQRQAEEAAAQERSVCEQTAPIFNQTVKNLQTFLTERANQTGEKLFSSFTNLPPAISFAFQHICLITNQAGTSPWAFDIGIRHSPRSIIILCANINTNVNLPIQGMRNSGSPASATIRSVRPFIGKDLIPIQGTGDLYVIRLNIICNLDSHTIHTTIEIKSNDPSRLYPKIEDEQPITDFSKVIDSALRSLIAAQTEQLKRITASP